MAAKMISMARSPEEGKTEVAMPAPMGAPRFPYGLCISLDDECLDKLGLDGDLPSVGEVVHFEAIAKVTSASMHETENPDGGSAQCCRVELQITSMGVMGGEKQRNWYAGTIGEDNDNDAA